MAKKQKVSKFIYWAPRVLSIMFLLFLAMFSLDVFDAGLGFWGTLLGLFMHNIPVFILTGFLIISWKCEIVGGITFILAGLLYITLTIFGRMNSLQWYIALSWSAIIAGPAFIIGTLFLLNWFGKKKKGKKK